MSRGNAAPKFVNSLDAQGFNFPESSTSGGARASRRGTGGVDDRGAAEEDGPVTWETPEVHLGIRATEDRRPPPTRRRQQAVRRPACVATMPGGHRTYA